MKSMGVKQGYAIVEGFFEIWENADDRPKLVEMNSSLHM